MTIPAVASPNFIPLIGGLDATALPFGYSRIGILYRNEADYGTIDVVDAVSTLPGTFLQSPQLGKVWRTPATVFASAIKLDLGQPRSVDCISVLACNLTAGGVTRVMLSNVDALSGELYDTTAINAGVDPVYKTLTHVLPSTVSARYVRVELYDDNLSYLEAGRLVVGSLWVPNHNYERGSIERGTVDDSVAELAMNNEAWVDERPIRRRVSFALPWVSEDERATHVDAMGRLAGRHRDVLVVVNSSAANLGQETYWGRMTGSPSASNAGLRAWRQPIEVITRA